MTDAERKLWFALRDRRFGGWKFRREVLIGPYIADFLCYEARLILEADGGQHDAAARDRTRDKWISANGFRTLRFWNNDILKNLEGVLLAIRRELENEPLTPSSQLRCSDDPLPQGEREKRRAW
jgi:very-short-patch-repair endonuclease